MYRAAGVLLLAGVAAVAPAAAQDPVSDPGALQLLEGVATAYQSARTLRATFTQTLSNSRTNTVYTSRGEFFQRSGDRFSFTFTEPAGDRIVSDGTVLWLYLPSTAKGQVLKVPKEAGGGLDIASSVLREPAKRYVVTAAGDTTMGGRTLKRVRMVPRTPQSTFTRGELWLDAQRSLVWRAEFVEVSGLVRLLEFSAIRTGATLPADAFTFVPPPGVRVMDQAALLGGSTRPPATP